MNKRMSMYSAVILLGICALGVVTNNIRKVTLSKEKQIETAQQFANRYRVDMVVVAHPNTNNTITYGVYIKSLNQYDKDYVIKVLKPQ